MQLEPALVRSEREDLLASWRDGRSTRSSARRSRSPMRDDAHALIETRRHVGKVVLEP